MYEMKSGCRYKRLVTESNLLVNFQRDNVIAYIKNVYKTSMFINSALALIKVHFRIKDVVNFSYKSHRKTLSTVIDLDERVACLIIF